jgi:indolepyruvate ferredoxin oxidoreductase
VVADPALLASPSESTPVSDPIELRVGELAAYQNERYARAYADEVSRVAAIAAERAGSRGAEVSDAYMSGLFKLMAYKDEYEVARLHLDSIELARREAEFGPGARVQIMLHPPALRALGLKRKLKLGRSAGPLLRSLRAARSLRGTPLDPFGYAEVRRVERALIGEYRELMRRALDALDADNVSLVAEIALLPELVRGYEQIKLRNVARFRERAGELMAELERRRSATMPVNGAGDERVRAERPAEEFAHRS